MAWHNDIEWGTVGEWFSGAGAFAAVVVALRASRRADGDAKRFSALDDLGLLENKLSINFDEEPAPPPSGSIDLEVPGKRRVSVVVQNQSSLRLYDVRPGLNTLNHASVATPGLMAPIPPNGTATTSVWIERDDKVTGAHLFFYTPKGHRFAMIDDSRHLTAFDIPVGGGTSWNPASEMKLLRRGSLRWIRAGRPMRQLSRSIRLARKTRQDQKMG
jgi:hypothetical protein